MSYSPKRPVSWTVVRSPGLLTLIAIEHPQYLPVVRVRVLERPVRVEGEVRLFVLEGTVLDPGPDLVELLPVHTPVFPYVPGLREDYRVLEILQPLLHVPDRALCPAVGRGAAGARDGVAGADPAAEAEGPLWGEGAGTYVFRDLDLLLGRDELVAPREAGDEADYGRPPRGAEGGGKPRGGPGRSPIMVPSHGEPRSAAIKSSFES